MHKPIQLNNVGLSFLHKTCFENVNLQIQYGSKIAIIGRNGSGKSTLLKMLQGIVPPTSGVIKIPEDVVFGYVPQVVEQFESLSGGQRLNEALTGALSVDPAILLLDEPTNHLDLSNRKSLMRMLRGYQGTLIVVSHDVELLRSCIDELWHIDNGQITVFSGNYDDYLKERDTAFGRRLDMLKQLRKEQRNALDAFQKEKQREAKSKKSGQVENDKTLRGKMKETGSHTAGKKRGKLGAISDKISNELSGLFIPEEVVPKFSLTAVDLSNRALITISEGSVGYQNSESIFTDIFLSIGSHDRVALLGDNGSGKSTFIKALLGDAQVVRGGQWNVIERENIGYLDQHYGTLLCDYSVFETIQEMLPVGTSHADVRRYLNDFLFRKNEEVNALVGTLSGGEKARLSLAQIAAKTPKLLILDEVTNNLDLETRAHVVEVLREYPGALLVISHDADFLKQIAITDEYCIKKGALVRC
jgi:ATPase subunit of ABC transporter with duplicated ATPase domains